VKAPSVHLLAIIGTAVLTACSSSPFGPAPEAEVLNSAEGGLVFDSVNTTGVDTTTATTSSDGGDSGAEEERGGLVFGSGH
jgi:hypothetical protein